jgi:hypothetical protein
MKHLKIYFAILFFSFLGSANAELMAQSDECKYGEELTTLRSYNGQFELSVSCVTYPYGQDTRPIYHYVFKLVRVGGPTIWENTIGINDCWGNVTIGKGRIMVKNNQCVLIGGDNGQGTGTFLRLENSGELALYGGSWIGDGDKVWSTGTCYGHLGGCGAVGSR